MAVLARDNNNISMVGGGIKINGPAHQADTFFNGALLFALNIGTGGKVSCVPTNTAADRFLGICSKQVTTTAADQPVEYFVGGIWLFPSIASITAVHIGSFLMQDLDTGGTLTDNVADLLASKTLTLATGDRVIGRIVGMDASLNMFVDLSMAGTVASVTTGGLAIL